MVNLADYNFSLEYQRGEDNTVADFLSRVESCLTDEEVEEYITKVPSAGVQALLDDVRTPITERAEGGDDLPVTQACVAEVISAYPVKLSTLHVTDWRKAQKEGPVLYTIVKNLKTPTEEFKQALKRLTDKKSIRAYLQKRDHMQL